MCECNMCKHSRGEITDKQYRRWLKKCIKKHEEEKWSAESNINEATELLGELEFEMKKNKEE